jgi:replicative DNA helicase
MKNENEFLHEDKVLCTILTYGNDFLEESHEIISNEMFIEQKRRNLFETFIEMNKNNTPIDSANVFKFSNGTINVLFLSEIQNIVPDRANFGYHLRKIYEDNLRRNLITKLEKLKTTAETEPDIYDALLKAEKEIESLDSISTISENPIDKELDSIFEDIESRLNETKDSDSLKFGSLPSLNRITGGIMPTDLIGLFGKEKSSKSTLAYQMVLDLAINQKIPCGVFSFEMSKKEMYWKAISMMTGIEFNKLRNPKGFSDHSRLKEPELKAIKEKVYSTFKDSKLIVSDEVFNEYQIQTKIKQWKKKFGVRLFIIDYLMLLNSSQRFTKRHEELNYLTRFFKQLAQKLEVPIVLISQANAEGGRAAEGLGLQRDANYFFYIEALNQGATINFYDSDTKENYVYRSGKDEFLVTNRGIRHGTGGKMFVTAFRENKYIEVDTKPRIVSDHAYNYYAEKPF